MILCSTTDYLFKLCFPKQIHHCIDDCNYCANCKRTSIYVNDTDEIDSENIERIYDDKLNEDCETVFQNSDEDANIHSAVNRIISIECNTVYNALPNYTCKNPEYITNI